MLTVTAAVFVTTLIALLAYRLGLRRGISVSSTPTSSNTSNIAAGRPAGQADQPGGGCVSFSEAAKLAGQQACVSGRVLRVFTSRTGNTFLDFCADYRNCSFTSVIFASDRPKFGDLSTLQGRDIELRGEVRVYHNQPEIVVSDPAQIREAP